MKTKITTKLIICFILIVTPILNLTSILANGLQDPNDRFEVMSPVASSSLKGAVNVSFRVYDNNQANVPFTAKLLDTSCTNSFGNISNITSVASHSSNTLSFTWDTRRTNSISSVQDGYYCLQLCVSLLNSSTPYNVCNSRTVQLINHNSLPEITSNPQNTTILDGQSYSYQVRARDNDGDNLRYRLIVATPEFSINSSTGQITSTQLSAGAGTRIYPVTLGVTDSISGEVRQSFSVSVTKPQAPKPPVTTPPTNPNPPIVTPPITPTPPVAPEPPTNPDDKEDEKEEETPDISEDLSSVKFTTISSNTEIKENPFVIRWEGFKNNEYTLSLEYSASDNNWNKIGESFNSSRSYYIWNLSGVENGKYKIRLNVKDKNDSVTYINSDEFTVKLQDSNDEENNDNEVIENKPLVINPRPENNSERPNNLQIAISADFVPSEGNSVDLESVDILVNGREFKEFCTITDTQILCTPEQQLEAGQTIVLVSYEDTSGQKAELEWTFNIVAPVIDESNENNVPMITLFGKSYPRSAVLAVMVILCIGSILLFVPWILYAMWSKNRKSKNIVVTENVNYVPTDTNQLTELQVYSDPYQTTSNNTYEPVQPIQDSYDVTNNYYYQPPVEEIVTQDNYVQQPQPEVNVTNNHIYPEQNIMQESQQVSDYNYNNNQSFQEPNRVENNTYIQPYTPVQNLETNPGTQTNTNNPQQDNFVEPTQTTN